MITIADYQPQPTIDQELATLAYTAVQGWPDQRPITPALVASRLQPAGHAPPTVIAITRSPNGTLIGAAALRWPAYPTTPGRLWGPVIHPHHQHQHHGHAHRLLKALTERLAARPVWLTTAEIPTTRHAAIRLYTRAGWQPAGTATLLKADLQQPPPPAPQPLKGLRLTTVAALDSHNEPWLHTAIADLLTTTSQVGPAGADDTLHLWQADHRYHPDCLILAIDHTQLVGVALTYLLAHTHPTEPTEALLGDLHIAHHLHSHLIRQHLLHSTLTTARRHHATVARAVVPQHPDLLAAHQDAGFYPAATLRYLACNGPARGL